MTFYTINNHQLFIETLGNGKNIITLHGGLGLDHTHFRPWLDPLAEKYKLLFYDQRGNGRSERIPAADLTFDTLGDDVNSLSQVLDIEKPIILSHSYGGFVGLNYALRYPDQLSGLVLISTCAYFDSNAASLRMQNANLPKAIIDEFDSDWETDDKLRQHFDCIGATNFAHNNFDLAKKVFGHTIFCAQTRRRAFDLLKRYDYRSFLARIQSPTLIIVGEDDIFTPPEMSKELASGISGSELHIIKDCGHFPYVEQPKLFFQIILKWLNALS